jgi:bifunctional N-acetylglucosamine-1-phosphate-uridyltransferase/glucosamine-1-phosphate-acetyltransferase GlmU-like protein
METLTVEKPLLENVTTGKKLSVIILLTQNSAFVGNDKPWELKLLGKSMKQWVTMACDNYRIRYVEYDGKQDIVEVAKANLDDSEYTMVLYSDTPLLRKKTVEEIVDYCFVKNMSVCKLTRGYVFNNEFLKNAEKIYTAEPQYFDEEDFMTVYNLKQLMLIEDILKSRIMSFHMKNGVRIIDGSSVSIDADVTIKSGTVIYPSNRIYGKTYMGNNVTLYANNIIQESYIDDNCVIEYSVIKNADIPARSNIRPFEKILK